MRSLRLAAALLLGAAPLTAQLNPTRHYAIEGARLVTVSGATIEQGNIVVSNGIITAVGRNARAPAGARVIDGSGLTVYPGLIDALSGVGITSRGGSSDSESAPYSWGPEDRPATMTWIHAADDLNASDSRLERWREAGFTSAITSPSRGLFPGQAAVINLAGERPNDMVVSTPVALRVNVSQGAGFRGYPGSLMGVFAYIRQLFHDARQYDRAWTIYEADPSGLERPEYDRALEPLREVLRENRWVLMPANRRREFQRGVQAGRDIGVRVLLYGGQEGYAVAGALARAGAPVLVSLDWPEAPTGGDPEAEPDLDDLRFWDRAPTTPAEFARAGVRFAFFTDGMSNPAEAVRNVRTAIDYGLTEAQAIRALTLTPAEIYGVSDRLGSLDAGKIGNLVVSRGDLFDGGSVRMVFVDGALFEFEARDAVAGNRNGGDSAVLVPVPMVEDRGPIDPADVTLIRNATVMTVTNGTLENASVLVRNGRIAEIGPNVRAPGNARIIDGTGRYVIPGIIDAHSHIAADAINEGTVSVSAMVAIRDVLNPEDLAIYRALAGGVTTANILHGSANPIGGQNAVVKLRWGADAQGLLFDGAPPGIKFALGENPKRDRNPDRYPNSRMGVMDVIRQAFIDAREYREEWNRYEAAGGARNARLIPPRRDLKLEALVEVLDGRRLVHAHSYRADEILQLLRLAEEFDVRIATLQHVLEGYKVAREIAEHGAGASTFSDWWAYKVEAYDAIPYNAALMTEKGVVVSINSDSEEEIRHLNQEAAKTMKWGGLTETQALSLVTLNPARQLGISDRVGSIEVGKDADLVIYNAHPLSVYAVPEMTLIDGQVYFDREHDRELRERLEAEKQALMDKHMKRRTGERAVTPEPAGGN